MWFSKDLHDNSFAIIFMCYQIGITMDFFWTWTFMHFLILISHYYGIITGSLQNFIELIMRYLISCELQITLHRKSAL